MAYGFNDDKSKAEIKLYTPTLPLRNISANSRLSYPVSLSGIISEWSDRDKILGIQSMVFPDGINCMSYNLDSVGGINYVFVLENVTNRAISVQPSNAEIVVIYMS